MFPGTFVHKRLLLGLVLIFGGLGVGGVSVQYFRGLPVAQAYTVPSSTAPPEPSGESPPSITNPVRKNTQMFEIRIDTKSPVLKVYRNGKLYHSYPVALGKSATPTPIGNWKVADKQKNWGGGFGTRWIGLDVPWGTYGIHGTNRPELIGKYVSNGCIRMRNADVEKLYNLIPIGTPVTITGNPLEHKRTLSLGNIGADVQLVQRRLQEAGYYNGPCDGKFGASTQFCVSLYELAHHLPMDAVVNDDDYRMLGLN